MQMAGGHRMNASMQILLLVLAALGLAVLAFAAASVVLV